MNSDSRIFAQSADWQDAVTRLSQVDRASWAIQRQLTARGVATVRFPRGTVVGFDGEPVSELAFVGFQGPGTTLAGTSLAAHASTVSEVLAAKNIPVVPGQVCTTTQIQRAANYARSVGYPVVVRPANSDRTRKPRIVVRRPEEMSAALQRVQTEATDRTVDREAGARTAWIQKVPTGQLLRVLVTDSEAVAAVVGDPETLGFEVRPVSEIHPDIRGAAVKALRAFPGLEHGEVDLVVQNLSQDSRNQQPAVMTVASSPVVGTYETGGDFGLTAAAAVTDHYLAKSGIANSEPTAVRSLTITYTGVVNAERFARRLKSRTEKLVGAGGNLETETSGEAGVSAIYRGDPGTGALLATLGVRGLVRGQRASTALTEVLE